MKCKMIMLVLVGLCLSLNAVTQNLDGATVDGVDLTSEEMTRYINQKASTPGKLKNIQRTMENALQIINDMGQEVINGPAETARAVTMRDDFKLFTSRILAHVASQKVTGVTIRTSTLTTARDTAQGVVTRAQAALDNLNDAEPATEQEVIDLASSALSSAETARDEAQAALDAFVAEND